MYKIPFYDTMINNSTIIDSTTATHCTKDRILSVKTQSKKKVIYAMNTHSVKMILRAVNFDSMKEMTS